MSMKQINKNTRRAKIYKRYLIVSIIIGSIMVFVTGKEYIEKKSKESKNIEYMGNVNNEIVLRYEETAELLINPRPDIGEYTKYSFPSKLIEYMTSGTPALVNKLQGVPEIYYDRLYLFSGYDMNSYKESLRKVLDIPRGEKKGLGEKAKSFILERNGIDAVARKLEKMINRLDLRAD